MSATITELTRLSPTTVSFSVEIPNRDELTFLPGQYVNIAVPDTDETRSYSFSSAPDDKTLSFLVKLTPGGVMSTYLDERAKVGDQLTFTGPNGSFFLREGDRPALLLAGGTGLAPILSILRKMRSSTSRKLHLIYGVNTDDDAVELDTLEHLAGELGTLTWDYCVADQASSAVNKGFVTALIDTRAPPRRRGVRLSVRPAADGRGGPQARRRRRCTTGRLLLRAVRAVRHRRRRCASRYPTSPRWSRNPKHRPWPPSAVPERPAAAVEVAAVLTGPEGRAVAGQIDIAQQGDCATRRCCRRDFARR